MGNVGDHIDKNGVAGLGLDGPLAKLDATRVPVSPVRAIRISLNANDHTVRVAGDIGRNPVSGTLQRVGVDVGVDAASGKENEIAEKIGLEDGDGKGIVGFEDLGNRGVKVPDEVHGHVVGDDLVYKGRVVDGPAGLSLAELLRKLALGGRCLPRLPDVGGELRIDVVGKLVLELLAQGLPVQLVQGDLGALLLGHARGVKGLIRLVLLHLLRLRLRLHRGRLGHVVGIFVEGGLGGRVGGLEQEEQGEAGERQHEGLLEGEHDGRGWPERRCGGRRGGWPEIRWYKKIVCGGGTADSRLQIIVRTGPCAAVTVCNSRESGGRGRVLYGPDHLIGITQAKGAREGARQGGAGWSKLEMEREEYVFQPARRQRRAFVGRVMDSMGDRFQRTLSFAVDR